MPGHLVFIPSMGTNQSQSGNVLFPYWKNRKQDEISSYTCVSGSSETILFRHVSFERKAHQYPKVRMRQILPEMMRDRRFR